MKLLTNNLGRIIAAIAAVALLCSVVVVAQGPVSSFFDNVVGKNSQFMANVDYNFNGPKIINGAGQTYEAGQATPLSFRSSAPIDTFKEVRVDGEIVNSSNYIVTEGSTIVTFNEDYSNALSDGEHTVAIVSEEGIADATFSVTPIPELTTLSAKTWNGFDKFYGSSVWTDGTNTYYSYGADQYVLNGDTWEPKTWNGLTKDLDGRAIWTDGTNIYYSNNYNTATYYHYVLNGDTWEPKTWKGHQNVHGSSVWTDGTNIYVSIINNFYILDGDTWKNITWNRELPYGERIWTDGSKTYHSYGSYYQYVLNGDTWEPKTWNGHQNTDGQYIWSDGSNCYYSNGTEQYVLHGDTWEPKTWNGRQDIDGRYIWSDGTNYYYSYGTNHYVLS